MKTIPELRQEILYVTKHPPEKILDLADKYIKQCSEMGDDFEVPVKHAAVKPIVDEFRKDLVGWRGFIISIRDALPARSEARAAVQEVQRKVNTRIVQQDTRRHIDAMVKLAVEKGICGKTYAEKLAFGNTVARTFTLRRKRVLDAHRAGVSTTFLDEAVKREILEDFWKQIDAEIANGEVLI